MAHLTLITGGIRSGKSRWAEELAGRHSRVTYVATTQLFGENDERRAFDLEMIRRVERHRRRRATEFPEWETIEEPWQVVEAIREVDHGGAILLECLNLWMTNLLIGTAERLGMDDDAVAHIVGELVSECCSHPATVIVVTNEVGWGTVPVNELARRFTDLLGEANQRFARHAAEVYACLAGIPVRLKPQPISGMSAS